MCDADGFIGWVALLFRLLEPGGWTRCKTGSLSDGWESLYLGLVRGYLEPEGFVRNASADPWILGYELSIGLVLVEISSRVLQVFCAGFSFQWNKDWCIYMSRHQFKGSRVMNGFSFDDRSSSSDYVFDWFYW